MIADKRYYLSRDRSRVVDEGDPDAGSLLAAKGDVLSNADVQRYGLGKQPAAYVRSTGVVYSSVAPPKEDEATEEMPAEAPKDEEMSAESKAVSAPPETKAQRRKDAEDK